jgi:hypothetical protein
MRTTHGALLLGASAIFGVATLYAVESRAGYLNCLYHSDNYDQSLDKTCSDSVTSIRGYAQAYSSNHLLTTNLLSAAFIPSGYHPLSTSIGVDSSGNWIFACSTTDGTTDGTSTGTWSNCGSAVKFDLQLETYPDIH